MYHGCIHLIELIFACMCLRFCSRKNAKSILYGALYGVLNCGRHSFWSLPNHTHMHKTLYGVGGYHWTCICCSLLVKLVRSALGSHVFQCFNVTSCMPYLTVDDSICVAVNETGYFMESIRIFHRVLHIVCVCKYVGHTRKAHDKKQFSDISQQHS